MINETTVKCLCCEDIRQIENYELAMNDKTKTWHCHHRAETSISTCEFVPNCRLTKKFLEKNGLYYNRPACELIFLTPSQHHKLHRTGLKFSEEHKKRMSEVNFGRKMSEEARRHMSIAQQNMSEETKRKIGDYRRGRKWPEWVKEKQSKSLKGMKFWNDGKITIRAKECPEGFKPGRVKN